MTRSTPADHTRRLGSIVAAVLAFAGAGIALASNTTDAKPDAHETVIVKIISDDGQALHGGAAHDIDLVEKCGGTKPQVDASDDIKDEGGKIRRARVVICNRLGEEQADIVAALEKARARVAKVSELSEAAKAKALASLDEEIARQKARASYSKQ